MRISAGVQSCALSISGGRAADAAAAAPADPVRLVSARAKWALVAPISVAVLGATGIFGVIAWQQYQERGSAPSAVDTTTSGGSGDRVVFRNTASGAGSGHVASVPLDRPDGERTMSDLVCNREIGTASWMESVSQYV